MRYSARKSETFDSHVGIIERGQRLSQELDLPLDDVRYATYTFHNGQQWTVECRWERRVKGKWVRVDWTEVTF